MDHYLDVWEVYRSVDNERNGGGGGAGGFGSSGGGQVEPAWTPELELARLSEANVG